MAVPMLQRDIMEVMLRLALQSFEDHITDTGFYLKRNEKALKYYSK